MYSYQTEFWYVFDVFGRWIYCLNLARFYICVCVNSNKNMMGMDDGMDDVNKKRN